MLRALGLDPPPPDQNVLADSVPAPTVRSAVRSSIGIPIRYGHRLLALAEFAAVIVAAIAAKLIYLDFILGTGQGFDSYVVIAACLGVVLYLVYNQMGLYDIGNLTGPQLAVGNVLGGLSVAMLIVLGLLYAAKETSSISRGWVLVWFVITAVTVLPVRALVVRWIKRGVASGLLSKRTAIVGSSAFASSLADSVRSSDGPSTVIDLYQAGAGEDDVRFVGGLSQLEEAMALRAYDRVIVAVPAADSELICTTVKQLSSYCTELLLCTDLNKMPLATNGSRQLSGIRADIIHVLPRSEESLFAKRAIDLILSVTALLALLPLFLLVAAAIKLDSRGPVFFRQRRLGRNGAAFPIFKFRSMTVAEDGDDVVQATRRDPRVTRIGRILRATSIDELPQLLNVVIGDMSLVGPRPHAIAHDYDFESRFDLFCRRRRVRPGITGWAQVNGFRGETRTADDVRRRMEHDLYYIDNWSIWLDLEILARTLFVFAKGAY